MLTWSNLQTVMQLVVGLNTAYYSFAEIRQPALTRESRAVANLRAALQAYLKNTSTTRSPVFRHANGELTQISIDVNTLRSELERFDTYIRASSLVVACIYTALLIVSSLYPDDTHLQSFPLALAIATVGFAPALTGILVNIIVAHFRLARLRRRRERIAADIHNDAAAQQRVEITTHRAGS